MAKRPTRLTTVIDEGAQQAGLAASRRREALDQAVADGPGGADEPSSEKPGLESTLDDPHAADKDNGGLGFGSFRDRGESAKADAEAEAAAALNQSPDKKLSAGDQAVADVLTADSGGFGEGSGSGNATEVTGSRPGSNLSFNPIADAQHSQQSTADEPGHSTGIGKDSISDGIVTNLNAVGFSADEGVSGGSTTARDNNPGLARAVDNVLINQREGSEFLRGEKTTTTGKDGTVVVKDELGTTTVIKDGVSTTVLPSGVVVETKGTTTTTTTPGEGEETTETKPDAGQPKEDPAFVPQSDFDPTGKGQQGGEVDGNDEEIAFAVSPGAELESAFGSKLDLIGNPNGPDFGGAPDGEAPTGSAVNDPGAVDPTDDTPDTTHTGPEDDPLDHSTGDPLEPEADSGSDDGEDSDDGTPLLHAIVAGDGLIPLEIADDLHIADD